VGGCSRKRPSYEGAPAVRSSSSMNLGCLGGREGAKWPAKPSTNESHTEGGDLASINVFPCKRKNFLAMEFSRGGRSQTWYSWKVCPQDLLQLEATCTEERRGEGSSSKKHRTTVTGKCYSSDFQSSKPGGGMYLSPHRPIVYPPWEKPFRAT